MNLKGNGSRKGDPKIIQANGQLVILSFLAMCVLLHLFLHTPRQTARATSINLHRCISFPPPRSCVTEPTYCFICKKSLNARFECQDLHFTPPPCKSHLETWGCSSGHPPCSPDDIGTWALKRWQLAASTLMIHAIVATRFNHPKFEQKIRLKY